MDPLTSSTNNKTTASSGMTPFRWAGFVFAFLLLGVGSYSLFTAQNLSYLGVGDYATIITIGGYFMLLSGIVLAIGVYVSFRLSQRAAEFAALSGEQEFIPRQTLLEKLNVSVKQRLGAVRIKRFRVYFVVVGLVLLALTIVGSGEIESGWDSFSRVGVWVGACLLFIGIFLFVKNHFDLMALNRVVASGAGLNVAEGQKGNAWMFVGIGFILFPFLVSKLLFGSNDRGGAEVFFLLIPIAGLFVLIGIILVVHGLFKRQ